MFGARAAALLALCVSFGAAANAQAQVLPFSTTPDFSEVAAAHGPERAPAGQVAGELKAPSARVASHRISEARAAELREISAAQAEGRAREPRIVNGTKSPITGVPWQVSVWNANYSPDPALNTAFDCGGTIIAPNRVVTAAHCVFGLVANQDPRTQKGVAVWAGVSSNNSSKLLPGDKFQERKVTEIRIHPSYNNNVVSSLGDMAVLTLESALTLDNVTAKVAALPGAQASDNGYPVMLGSATTVSGYGLQVGANPANPADPGSVDDMLYTLGMDQAPPFVCEPPANNAGALCLASPNGSACQGDSGGPAVIGGLAAPVVVGIASNVSAGCPGGVPNSYANLTVPEHRVFVDTNTVPIAPRQTAPIEATWPKAGVLRAGERLNCQGGAWSGAPLVKWQVISDDGTLVGGGDGASYSYVVRGADVGKRLICVAYASNGGGVQMTEPLVIPVVVTEGRQYAYIYAPSKAKRGSTFTAYLYVANLPSYVNRGGVSLSGAKWHLKKMNLSRLADDPDTGVARMRIRMPKAGIGKGKKVKLRVKIRTYNGKKSLRVLTATTRVRAR